ncbi:MAG: TIGR02221 family CRISPR-associated protein [Thiobacillus sp.]
MTTTLISFLGRAPKGENGYRKTLYRFPDGIQTEPLAFFGWALHRRLSPGRVAILGTAGSMWDHLFEGDIALGDALEAERLALIESVNRQHVEQSQLDELAPALAQALGCAVSLVVIPYARDHAEQVSILQAIAEQVGDGDRVHLDVTHGFRHLPMLALLAALHLRLARQAKIDGIWYGAFDPDTGDAPVHQLSGLLHIADGVQALATFDKDGDYGVFEPLLRDAGLQEDARQALRKAAYYENILNVGAATGELRRVRQMLDTATLKPEGQLLLPAIEKRLAWLDEDRQFEKQTRLARQAFARSDYLRATLYAFEATISRLCQIERVPIDDFDKREEVRKNYETRLKQDRTDEREAYFLLKNLRNQVAHGTRGSVGEVQQALLNQSVMREKLADLIGRIERGQLPAPPA